MELRPIDAKRLEPWRKRYRSQLGIPVIPEYYEALCQWGRGLEIEEVGQILGYAVLAEEPMTTERTPLIAELFLDMPQTKYARQMLLALLDKLKPKVIVTRTDDPGTFPLLMDLGIPNQVCASLYSIENDPQWVEDPQWPIQTSGLQDAMDLLPIYASVTPAEGGIPDERSLSKNLAAWPHYRLQRGDEVLAVGYTVPLDHQYVAITPIVPTAHRGKGYGRYLVAYMLQQVLTEGKVVLASVDPDHEAARALAESLGGRLHAHVLNFMPTGE